MRKKRKLKPTYKWLLLVIVIALLILFLQEFLQHYHLLVARLNTDQDTINTMNHQIEQLQRTNANLNIQMNYMQHHPMVVKINGTPVVEKPVIHVPLVPPVPLILVGALSVLGGMLKLIPAF